MDGGRRAVRRRGDAWNALAQQCFTGSARARAVSWPSCSTGSCSRRPWSRRPRSPATCRSPGTSPRRGESLARVLNRGAFPVDVEVQRVRPCRRRSARTRSGRPCSPGSSAWSSCWPCSWSSTGGWCSHRPRARRLGHVDLQHLGGHLADHHFALTLAGVTGIIVAIGITVDSYVIYFERLKDEVVHGRTLSNWRPAASGRRGARSSPPTSSP